MPTSIDALPNELLARVFGYLDQQALSNVSQVSRSFHEISNYDFLWSEKHIWRNLSPTLFKKLDTLQNKDTELNLTWKKAYLRRALLEQGWRKDNPRLQTLASREGSVSCLKIASGDTIITGSFKGDLNLWRLSNGQHIQTLPGHFLKVHCLQVDDHVIISGSADTMIRIWSRKLNKCVNTLNENKSEVTCLFYNSRKLISGSLDGHIRVWNFSFDKIIYQTSFKYQQPIRCFSSYRSQSLLCGMSNFVLEFDVDNGKIIECYHHSNMQGTVTCIETNEEQLVVGTTDNLHVFQLESAKHVTSLEGHSNGVTCMKLDGNKLVTGSEDKTIKLWNIRSLKFVRSFSCHSWGVRSVDFSESRLVSGSFDELLSWVFPLHKETSKTLVRRDVLNHGLSRRPSSSAQSFPVGSNNCIVS
eukprot:TRINITY_DN14798_c0_g1_i1.p1 TRINITY_DN14798_c0_g1~~TRINITY_DN14798_c0_g1_i1.p1  ORF type:complete len:432 (-),score=55.43 TRINITY_DN14798_c0_g1_i1:49-1293(-)